MLLTDPIIIVWTIGYILMISGVIAVLVWAFLNNKKRKYDRARYLPLFSGSLGKDKDKDEDESESESEIVSESKIRIR